MRTLRTQIVALLGAAFSFLAHTSYSQAVAEPVASGLIGGLVVDLETAMPLIGATVVIEGSELSAVSDLDGRYQITGVPAGSVNVIFTRNGYQEVKVDNVTVSEGVESPLELGLPRFRSELEKVLEEGVVELEAFVVDYEEVVTNSLALLADRQKSASVSDAIGSDLFASLGLGDAAEAMGKVTGASVVDGKYVVIRGLGDRYSNTLLNGSTVPSADPDRRAVQMDQFPSDLLESIVTTKSFTPDQPGSFSGGSVNIKTKSFPEYFFVKFGAGVSYNENATGEDILVTAQGVDRFANGKGDREAPEIPEGGIPERRTALRDARQGNLETAQTLDAITRAFPRQFYPELKKAPVDTSLDLSFGDSIPFGREGKFGYTLSFTSDESYSYYEDGIETRFTGLNANGNPTFSQDAVGYSSDNEFNIENLDYYTERYTLDSDGNIDLSVDQPLDPYFNDIPFGVTESTQSANWGAFAKFAAQFNANHELGLTLFHNQSADDVVSRGIGFANPGSGDGTDQFVEGISVQYTERAISSAQLSGKHFFPQMGDATIEWQYAKSRSTQDQPDFRTLFWGWDYEENGIWNAENNLGGVDRLFRELSETRDEYKVDLSLPVADAWDLKFGGLLADSEREYRETGFVVEPRSSWENIESADDLTDEERVRDQYSLIQNIYTDETIGFNFDEGIELDNGGVNLAPGSANRQFIQRSIALENRSNLYDGVGETRAAYLMADTRAWDKWRFIFGARYESNRMDVTQFLLQDTVDDRRGGFDSSDVLPAFSSVYEISESMNVRFAYGRTLALPTFKELSPVEVSNRFSGTTEQGNPVLERTLIDNLDLRWEWFLENGQIIAVSAFYKSMENPIEVVITPGADLDGDGVDDLFAGNQVPQNVGEATVYGLELEWRYDLFNLSDLLRYFSIAGNLSLIESEVDVPQEEQDIVDPEFLETSRQLVGQSPFLFNLDLSFSHEGWGSSAALSFNFTDDRLSLVNPTKVGGLGNVIEKGRGSLNFTWTQQIGDAWSVKFSASNLLNPDYEEVYENLTGGEDIFYSLSDRGRSFGISASYTFD